MEVGFGRGVGRKGNGMMRERMKTEDEDMPFLVRGELDYEESLGVF